ncbi:L,D-transpeptidase [Seohaeicola sp. SP36]|uniref:L,D-transpeptidase n=1 Tax=unclassified Seohaeicola TaxID=2641111 RepID=UPI00237A33A5|nr:MULTISPECIES: L,D-transpeptidase [unclassified Seohaeicola]MDD9707321.1 L,D-transpeptidase [Seohaeicola sp. 4SK31]MDD9735704.1 L,D-transpeptidase [Seohaeicola sp. SP36]
MADNWSRRTLLAGGVASLLAGRAGAAQEPQERPDSAGVRNNLSSFRMVRWQDHFDSLENGVILADTRSRAVHFWSEDESIYRLYPSSVPASDDLTRLGYTKIVRTRIGPTWTPTPSMRERDPSLPVTIAAGPENPLGTHALYLSWQYYLIHGTHDTRKIGRASSDGCIGLYNDHIEELFGFAKVGTQVRLI